MARIRTIKPDFWNHPVMSALPDAARLAAIGLLNLADDEGYFFANPALVRSFLWPFDECSTKARTALETLSKCGFIEIRESQSHGEIGLIISFKNHQRIDRPSASKIRTYFDSANIRRTLDDQSSLERKGKERKGKECKYFGAADAAKQLTTVNDTKCETDGSASTPAKSVDLVPIPEELRAEPFTATWNEWIAFRRKKRYSCEAPCLARQLKSLAPLGPRLATECVELSLRCGYRGIFPEKFTNGKHAKRHGAGQIYDPDAAAKDPDHGKL